MGRQLIRSIEAGDIYGKSSNEREPGSCPPSSLAPRPSLALRLAEAALLPDFLIRAGIRRLCAQRLRDEHAGDV